MPDDLAERLVRLNPTIDSKQAMAIFDVRRRQVARRRIAARVSAPVLALALIGAVLATRSDDPNPAVHPDETPTSVVARDDGFELEITGPRQAIVGTRVPVAAVVRNLSDRTVYWEAGGCRTPVSGSIRPSESHDDTAPSVDPWTGDLATLAADLIRLNSLGDANAFQPDDATGLRDRACPADSRMEPFRPGDRLEVAGTVEVRLGAGPLADGGRYEIELSFGAVSDPEPEGPQTADVLLTPELPIQVLDNEERTETTARAATAAAASDPRVEDWVERTRLRHLPQVTQTWDLELSWWRGAWELWIDPTYDDGGPGPLRVRYDPTTGEIIDLRAVTEDQAPEDEPGAVKFPGQPPDEIL